MNLNELKEKFLEYAKSHQTFDVVDDFDNDILFDADGNPLFDVDSVIRKNNGKTTFSLKKLYIVSEDEENELDSWMQGFLGYAGIVSVTPLHHSVLNDCGADYDVEIHCILELEKEDE